MDTPRFEKLGLDMASAGQHRSDQDALTAWLAQEVTCPCQNVGYMLIMPTLDTAYDVTPRCDMCHGDTHLMLGELIQKLEAK